MSYEPRASHYRRQSNSVIDGDKQTLRDAIHSLLFSFGSQQTIWDKLPSQTM